MPVGLSRVGVKSGTIKTTSFFLFYEVVSLLSTLSPSHQLPFRFDSFFSFNEITVTIEKKTANNFLSSDINNELNLREHVITSHDFIHRRSYFFLLFFFFGGGRRKSLVGGRESSAREIQSKVRGQPSENLTLMTLENEQKFLVVVTRFSLFLDRINTLTYTHTLTHTNTHTDHWVETSNESLNQRRCKQSSTHSTY